MIAIAVFTIAEAVTLTEDIICSKRPCEDGFYKNWLDCSCQPVAQPKCQVACGVGEWLDAAKCACYTTVEENCEFVDECPLN